MKKLPRTELQIMKFIWSKKEEVVRSKDITEYMEEIFHWTKGATSKTLSRLCEKGFLSSEKNGRKVFYTILVSEEEYLKFETKDFFNFVHDSSLSSIISSLGESSEDISDEDVKRIEDWIKNR